MRARNPLRVAGMMADYNANQPVKQWHGRLANVINTQGNWRGGEKVGMILKERLVGL